VLLSFGSSATTRYHTLHHKTLPSLLQYPPTHTTGLPTRSTRHATPPIIFFLIRIHQDRRSSIHARRHTQVLLLYSHTESNPRGFTGCFLWNADLGCHRTAAHISSGGKSWRTVCLTAQIESGVLSFFNLTISRRAQNDRSSSITPSQSIRGKTIFSRSSRTTHHPFSFNGLLSTDSGLSIFSLPN